MPRPPNTELRKKQIVEAMVSVMGEYGYAGATIPQVAKRARLLPGLVHYHFENKEAILLAVLEHLAKLVEQRFDARKTKDPTANLAAYIDAQLAYGADADSAAVACWISIGAAAVHQVEVQAALQNVTEQQILLIESLCKEILKSQRRSIAHKRQIALGVFAAIEGSYHLLVSAPNMIATGFAAPTVKAMANGLISAQTLVGSNKRRT